MSDYATCNYSAVTRYATKVSYVVSVLLDGLYRRCDAERCQASAPLKWKAKETVLIVRAGDW